TAFNNDEKDGYGATSHSVMKGGVTKEHAEQIIEKMKAVSAKVVME
ncbi:50S ribosomal protein L7/L12, putative, partial [Tanacetum coccineum]